MKTYWMDTESCMFIGPTILIQWSESTDSGELGEIHLHNVFDEPAGKTCALIEKLMSGRLVGFNLSHDMFHLSKTYNLCKQFSYSEKPADHLLDLADFHTTSERADYCLLPKKAIDLMLIGQRNQFQALVKQKPIRIKKIPRLLAEALIDHLEERIELNPLYFAGFKEGRHWQIKELWRNDIPKIGGTEIGNASFKPEEVDSQLVNLVLPFNPKKGLKDIMTHLLNKKVEHFSGYGKKYKERFWNPNSEEWLDVIDSHLTMWRDDPNQRQYASDDILYTYELDKYFNFPDEDVNSLLACVAGNQYWKGYDIDIPVIDKEYTKYYNQYLATIEEVNINAPRDCLEYLKKDLNPVVADNITDTTAETLEILSKSNLSKIADKAKLIIQGRNSYKRVSLLDRLRQAGKMYAQFKIGGTATNRKSGGNDEQSNSGLSTKSESINPQGLPREDEFREAFIFNKDFTLSGGDAVSFEVNIAAAVFDDKDLTNSLKDGKSFHGLFGSEMYNIPYEEFLLTKKLEGKNNLYNRAKSAVFAWFYGAEAFKMAETLGLEQEEVQEGIDRLESRFPGIKRSRELIWNKFQALRQPNGIGTAVVWHEPDKQIETKLGFKRDFTVEIETMRALFHLAQDLPKDLKELNITVTRNLERGQQTSHGAVMSALYAAAFNIQSQIMRIASNFVIQSLGAEIIKNLEYEIINTFQPRLINEYKIMTFNVHDELQCPHLPGLEDSLKELVDGFVKRYKEYVPLFEMDWGTGKNWAGTH